VIVDTCLPVDTTKDHLACLERHLLLWKDGNILTLLEEGNIIQQSLPSHGGRKNSSSEDTARVFARLMFQGKVKAALRFHLINLVAPSYQYLHQLGACSGRVC